MWVIKPGGIPWFDGESIATLQGSGREGIGIKEEAVDEFESVAIACIETLAKDADRGNFGR